MWPRRYVCTQNWYLPFVQRIAVSIADFIFASSGCHHLPAGRERLAGSGRTGAPHHGQGRFRLVLALPPGILGGEPWTVGEISGHWPPSL